MIARPCTSVISIIIPNYNGSATIEQCLEAAFASRHDSFEVIVVDDCSTDDSVERIRNFPCKAYQLPRHGGASRARNSGARHSSGEILFFIDADCLLQPETLSLVEKSIHRHHCRAVVGGTYTPRPADPGFFNTFQSIFINYSETKNPENPDYIASHAMAVPARIFRRSGGFPEHFMPILEDVEFSHRLRRQGYRLVMAPEVRVRHIFNFSFRRSLANAVRKSRYWTRYSLGNRDLLADSGTASRELKLNILCWLTGFLLLATVPWLGTGRPGGVLAIVQGANLVYHRRMLLAFYQSGGAGFATAALLYYLLVYPLGVVVGAGLGTLSYLLDTKRR